MDTIINLLNKINIVKKIENGELYIKPLNIFLVILLIIIDYILVSKIEIFMIKTFDVLDIVNNFILNITLFIIQILAALFSLNIITFFIKDKHSISNYKSNKKTSDCIYLLLMILGFRFFYEGSIYQLKGLLTINLEFNSLLLSCIYAPLVEEVLYRGIFLNGLLKNYNYKFALIFCSLIFAIMHFNFFQGINAFFIGLMIGLIYIKTKSLYLCIFMHFCNNFIVLYLPTLLFEDFTIYIIYMIFNVIAGIILLYLSYTSLNLNTRKKVFTDKNNDSNFFI